MVMTAVVRTEWGKKIGSHYSLWGLGYELWLDSFKRETNI